MENFEKLGAFYLGKRLAAETGEPLDELVLYDSKDLTTHAAIIGMTGSGKTGLGIGLIEEAAMDRIPVIAIDPKGDLANLLLTFPDFRGADFEPWVDARAAADSGKTVAAYATEQAQLWQRGLAGSGQTGERIRQLKANCDFAVYTPGSTAGTPLAILGEFTAPAADVRADTDVYSDIVDGTTTSLLGLLDIAADPVSSKEHILIANVLRSCWDHDQSLDLAGLIGALQAPPFSKIGVLDTDTFFPPAQRFELAMKINNLLAASGFAAWLQGEPLDIDRLLYTESGQPRVSVLSIAHLDDRERMFFVGMLLNALLGWMRRQSGSSALRAMLYIDEIFGFMPPVANPPSKRPLLTLLKQARAFGLGLVLSTQNPVDLDYKGMSNMGTWFIGRLQTERDQQRVLDGLRSANGAATLDTAKLPELLSSLGKRCFLLHNVHEQGPVLFSTRWVMSYLAGPLSRSQIGLLRREPGPTASTAPQPRGYSAGAESMASRPPVLEPGVKQQWSGAARLPRGTEQLVYEPGLLAEVSIHYTNARLNVDADDSFGLVAWLEDDDTDPDWAAAEETAVAELRLCSEPAAGARYGQHAAVLGHAKAYAGWEKKLRSWLRRERALRLMKSATLKLTSTPGETERDFRIRLQQHSNELRDIQVGKLREKYNAKVNRLEEQLLRAEQMLDKEAEQATSSKIDTALSIGTAVLGALLGRKRISTTSVSKASTAARRADSMRKQMGDVKRAEAKVAAVEADIEALKTQFDAEVAALEDAYDAQQEELEEVLIKARATHIEVRWLGILWQPKLVELADAND
ncbi:MAG: DUF87 domain-containing protein [Gammaproteobacteria bacterium]|jgi:hypothetical protein|nr:DUF87 domain-containing protein [Gammaproteobacteria bacterium]